MKIIYNNRLLEVYKIIPLDQCRCPGKKDEERRRSEDEGGIRPFPPETGLLRLGLKSLIKTDGWQLSVAA